MAQHEVTILSCDVCGHQQACSGESEFFGLTFVSAGVAIRQLELCAGCLRAVSTGLRGRYGVCRAASVRLPGCDLSWDALDPEQKNEPV